jgi:exonuclease V gamma subunit
VFSFPPIPDARKHLAALARLYEVGIRAPLAFAPESSGDYATTFRSKPEHEAALAEAQKTYAGGYYKGEREMNQHLQRVFGEDQPPFANTFHLGPDFPTLARAVFDPLLDALIAPDEKRKR